MAFSVLQSNSATLDPGAAAVTYTSNVQAGTKLIAFITTGGGGNPQVTAVKDAALNSMTKVGSAFLNNAAANGELSIWAMDTPAGDVGTKPTLTATQTGGNQSFGMVIQEVSGLAVGNTLAAMIDGTAVASTGSIASNGSVACGSYSTAASGEYLVAVGGDNEASTLTWAVPTGSTTYTRDAKAVNASVVFNCVPAYGSSTGGAETASFAITGVSTTTPWATLFVAFKLAATAAPAASGAARYAPGWHPGQGLPGMPGGTPFLSLPRTGDAPAAAPQAGPPVYPLGRPVQARQLPQRGGWTSGRDGTYSQAGPPVRPARGPVKAQPAVPVLTGRADGRAGIFAGIGAAVKALTAPVAARLRVLPPRGRTAGKTGTYAGTGPAVRPPDGPVKAQPAPQRGGRTAGRTGTYTQVTLGAGPPVYPLGHPVQARRLPQRGGTATGRRGTYAGTGPQVRPPDGPVRAAQPLPPHGRTQGRTGTFTQVVTGSGPPVYPLHHPVTAPRQQPPRGRVVRAAGTYAGTGPPARQWHAPVGTGRQQPPPPARGRTASLRGPAGVTGPPVIRLRKPVRGQPQVPVLTGRADGRAGVLSIAPFNVARSTATVTTADTSAATATDPRDGTASVTARATSAPAVTDPRDGASAVARTATSTPGVT